MKRVIVSIMAIAFFFLPTGTFAAETVTADEVASHATEDDCFMIFDEKVYDISEMRLKIHDKYQDIRSWCGRDITSDFKTKDGLGKDHLNSTYDLLESYYIGDLVVSDTTSDDKDQQIIDEDSSEGHDTKPKTKNPYNFYMPVLITLLLYVITKLISKSSIAKEKKIFSRPIFDFFWNSLMILGLLPSVVFGVYMVFSFSFPKMREIVPFEMLYWHVELSLMFATALVLHILQRLKRYIAPVKGYLLLRRSSSNGNRS